ncbi:MAG TPA: N-acetylmuramoyl-L-alanine amidase, partial [Blastocatellia bacterium]|nr:N-acetylmuramoyl-L-alanine amidase [Blastocatellia bacterium]
NASSNKDATGIEALAHPSEKKLAQSLCKALALATGLKLRGESGYKSASSGQHSRLGFCDAGGVVLEVCFLTNPADFEAYKSAFNGVSEALANALALAAQGKGV